MTPERRRLLDLLAQRLGPASHPALEPIADALEQQLGGPSAALDALAVAPLVPDIATLAPTPDAGTGPSSPPIWSPQPNRYVVSDPNRPHKEGGLGAVFIAHDTEVDRKVALKEIKRRQADNPGSRARFVFEASVTGKLEHPGIVPIYGLGTHGDGRPYYAMRFIEGKSFEDAIRAFQDDPARDLSARSLPLRQLLERFLAICDAMQYAHDRGVLHRDLKPQNVMLGEYGETLVVDWGLARLWKEPGEDIAGTIPSGTDGSAFATLHGVAIGTPGYMSPEQAAGRLGELGPATDIYGLGAILYSLLTGRPVHISSESTQLPDLLAQIERGEFEPPRSIRPEIDPALEAIALKSLARLPADRYPSARALADDVRRWLADEPVSAWREPFGRRARRWVGKHRTLVTGVAVGLLAVLLATVAYSVQRLTTARGRVEALRSAQIRAVPEILGDLGPDRRLVVERLKALIGLDQPSDTQLRGLLALVKDDPTHAAELTRRMLLPSTTPDELIVIRESIGPDGVGPALTDLLRTGDKDRIDTPSDEQLRAFAALAKFAPNQERWPREADGLAAKLTRENPLRLGAWREVFQPISRHLLEPLRKRYADQNKPEDRDRAYVLLSEYATQPDNPNRAEDLAALILDADPQRFDQILALLSDADRPRAIAVLTPQLAPLAKFDDLKAQRQGRIGAALLKLKADEPVWPLFQFADDPSTRTELIHNARDYGVEIHLLLDRLKSEPDVSARRALLLAIGSYPPNTLPDAERQALIATWVDWYRNDPDAGVHGAVAWVLDARWNQGAALRKVDQSLAGQVPPEGRHWFVNKEGQTYTIIRGHVEFLMGSTKEGNPDHAVVEVLHRRRIPRSFAVASREVRVEEYARFLAENKDVSDLRTDPLFRQAIPSVDCAMGVVNYYDAARYCNWLSRKDGLPESEWCYPTDPKPGMTLPKDHLERKGYRLPTEAEWEYFTRAGTLSTRSYGRLESRLPAFGWFLGNSKRQMNPTGRLKPNDLGLFDTLGNAFEWCGDPYGPYTGGNPERRDPFIDALVVAEFSDQRERIIRGGAFVSNAAGLRSPFRFMIQPSVNDTVSGVRPARTYP